MTEDTLPPRKPNTPRNFIAWLMAKAKAHPVWAAAILGAIVGFVMGKVL